MVARVGVLALQGAFAAHADALRRLGLEPALVRDARDLSGLAGIALPGGESTTQLKLLERRGLDAPLDAFVRAGRPVLATCAVVILAAREVVNPAQRSFGWLHARATRNAYGRQLDSFTARSDDGELELVFIRAPRMEALGAEVEVLATHASEPVLVRQGALVAAAFHPELTDDLSVHRLAFGALLGDDG